MSDEIHRDAMCYNLNDGSVIWDHPSHGPLFEHPDGSLSPITPESFARLVASWRRRLN